MEDKVTWSSTVNELQRPLFLLLLLLRAICRHDPVQLYQVEKDCQLEDLTVLGYLHGLEGGERHLPFRFFELHGGARLVKLGLHIDHEVVGEDKETSLVHHVSVPLDNESVALVAIVTV